MRSDPGTRIKLLEGNLVRLRASLAYETDGDTVRRRIASTKALLDELRKEVRG